MNLFANVANQKRSQMAFGVIFCLALSLLAPALVAQPVTSSNRFLFIIDTSVAMKPWEMSLRETVFDLIYSGARGRMQNGDTYGVWLVKDKSDTSFRMETWKSKHVVELAAQATSHVKTNGFKGKARLDVALADALRVIKKIDDLTVIVVSNGETPLAGTPFDEEINARALNLAPQMKVAKATVNTALVAQNGEFVAWAINSPDFLIDIPQVAPKPKPAKPAVVTTAVPPAKAMALVSNATVVAKPRVALAPIIITKDSVAKEKLTYASSTTNFAEPPEVVKSTNTTSDVVVTPATNAVAVPATNQTNTVLAKVVNEAPKNSGPAVSTARAVPVAVVANEADSIIINTSADRESQATSEQSGNLGTALLWAAAGAGFMLICVAIVFALSRRSRPEPSLISQALARERLLH